jgi:hypothetical protein
MDFPDAPAKKLKVPKTMSKFLAKLTKVLELNRPVMRIYDETGFVIQAIESVLPKSTVYVSTAVGPKATVPLRGRMVNMQNLTGWPVVPIPKPLKPVPAQPLPPDYEDQHVIASSKRTVRECLRDAIMSVYDSLQSDHKRRLDMLEAYDTFASINRLHWVQHCLLSRFIGPTSVIQNSDLGRETFSWLADQLSCLTPSKCRVVITGPSQSGKSTVLWFATLLFVEKLQIVQDSGTYLVVPFNWCLHDRSLETLSGIYEIFVRATFSTLHMAKVSLIPVLDILQNWFLGLLARRGFQPLPPLVLRLEGFPEADIIAIGRTVHDLWFGAGSLDHFVLTITRFPRSLGEVFGFTSVVYVYDHFDAASVTLPGEGHFPDSRDVFFPDYLCRAAADGPFFIASQCDDEFHQCFQIQDAILLTTDRIITERVEKELWVVDPPFCLKHEHCRGCPGYCAIYNELCSLATIATERVATGIKAKYRAVVDCTRRSIVTEQFLRLCLLIEGGFNGSLDLDLLNRLSYIREFEIHAR